VPENRDQGIGLNGSVKKRIFAVFIRRFYYHYVGRSGHVLKPGTVGFHVIHGSRNGMNTTLHPPSSVPGQDPTFLPIVKPFREPLMTETTSVPGFRLGPDLPRRAFIGTPV